MIESPLPRPHIFCMITRVLAYVACSPLNLKLTLPLKQSNVHFMDFLVVLPVLAICASYYFESESTDNATFAGCCDPQAGKGADVTLDAMRSELNQV